MPRTTDTPAKAYQSKQDPNLHKGTVSITGTGIVDLGLGHNNFSVQVSKVQALEPLDVVVTKLSGRDLGKFSISLQEVAARLITGGLVSAPTTPSTQATGASGITVLNANIGGFAAQVGGVLGEGVAAVDASIHAGTVYPALVDGFSAVVAAVLKQVSGVFSVVFVKGTALADGSEVSPTDDEIQADGGVGDGVTWLRLCDILVRRTGDTELTITYKNRVRFTPKDSLSALSVDFVAHSDAAVI